MTSAPADRILVVDDDKAIRQLLRQTLELKGYQIGLAEDGVAAIEILQSQGSDLVVLDLLMPSLDGWAALTQVRALPSPPPVVVISGTTEVDLTPRIFREGVDAFIAKPFRLEVLVNVCQELIARAKGRTRPVDRRRLGERRTLPLAVAIAGLDGASLCPGRVVNLSVLGAQVELALVLSPGERVSLTYQAGGQAPLCLECRVQWWRRDAPTGRVSHGFAFTGVSAESRARIKALAALA
jgi:DNA-binding response OmpR family regulator